MKNNKEMFTSEQLQKADRAIVLLTSYIKDEESFANFEEFVIKNIVHTIQKFREGKLPKPTELKMYYYRYAFILDYRSNWSEDFMVKEIEESLANLITLTNGVPISQKVFSVLTLKDIATLKANPSIYFSDLCHLFYHYHLSKPSVKKLELTKILFRRGFKGEEFLKSRKANRVFKFPYTLSELLKDN